MTAAVKPSGRPTSLLPAIAFLAVISTGILIGTFFSRVPQSFDTKIAVVTSLVSTVVLGGLAGSWLARKPARKASEGGPFRYRWLIVWGSAFAGMGFARHGAVELFGEVPSLVLAQAMVGFFLGLAIALWLHSRRRVTPEPGSTDEIGVSGGS